MTQESNSEEIGAIQSEMELKKVDKEKELRNWNETKIAISHDWIENEGRHMSRTIRRGGVFLCDLGENIGSEQNGVRPVLVISNNRINGPSGQVKVIPLSSRLRTKRVTRNGQIEIIPQVYSHYFLKMQKYNFLNRDSAVKVEALTTVSKSRLKRYLGTVQEEDLNKIIVRLKWVFDM